MARLTAEQDAHIVSLLAVDPPMSRNAIAKQVGCSSSTVSARAKKAGHEFPNQAPAAAVEAARFDHAVRKQQLQEKALLFAEKLFEHAITRNLDPKELADISRAITGAVAAMDKLDAKVKNQEAAPVLNVISMLVDMPARLEGEDDE